MKISTSLKDRRKGQETCRWLRPQKTMRHNIGETLVDTLVISPEEFPMGINSEGITSACEFPDDVLAKEGQDVVRNFIWEVTPSCH
jgi:hypothetical protein